MMRNLFVLCILSAIFLCACDINEIKDAAAGINKAADKAATSISEEVHSIRAIEITHENKTFTVNDIYKSILRDVQWHYENEEFLTILDISGTWQPTLLEQYNLSLDNYPQLDETGKVTITLYVTEGVIDESVTKVKVEYEGNTLLEQQGIDIQRQLYDYYINL